MLVGHDPERGDWSDNESDALIKQAGKLLHDSGDMRNPLVWGFIPKRYRRGIDLKWDGIGSWRA